jgi:uncharacterized protein involved in exopolysaccharide biosynthesis
MFIGAVVAGALVISKPALYRATASFVSQGGNAARAGLAASLAGQFGLTLPNGNQSFPPELYSNLLKSRVVLLPIVHGTFVMPEMGGKRVSFLDLFKIQGKSMAEREDRGVNLLASMVMVSVDKNTGAVGFSAATKWRSVSFAIATALLNGINNFNASTNQGQAAAERQFLEGRLTVAGDDLRAAEDRLEHFLQTNREVGSSPALMLEEQRIQREIDSRQQVFISLTQLYADARMREVRDTPAITVIEPPSVPALPEPRGRLIAVLLGFFLGGFVGVFLVFVSETMARYSDSGSAEANEFIDVLLEIKEEWRRLMFFRRNYN